MKSSGLAFAVLTLVGTLAALDLSGAHQLPADYAVTSSARSVRLVEDQSPAKANEVSVAPLPQTRSGTQAIAMNNGPAVHRCGAELHARVSGPAAYCFGAPDVEIDYN